MFSSTVDLRFVFLIDIPPALRRIKDAGVDAIVSAPPLSFEVLGMLV